jgi:hypothetical protein
MSRVDRTRFHNQVNATVAKLGPMFHFSADSKGIEKVKLQNWAFPDAIQEIYGIW